MNSARSKAPVSARQPFSNKQRVALTTTSTSASSSVKGPTTIRGGGGNQASAAAAPSQSSSMASLNFAPDSEASSVVLSARRANQQYLLEQQQQQMPNHSNVSIALNNSGNVSKASSSLVEEEERRFSALSPKSTTSICGTPGESFFPSTPENNKENVATGSSPGKVGLTGSRFNLGAEGGENEAVHQQRSSSVLLSEEQGSPEESCWLVRKEEIAEARSASKQVLTRMPSMHHPLNNSSSKGKGSGGATESFGRRSVRSASTPIQPLNFDEPALTVSSTRQQQHQDKARSSSATPLTPTEVSSIFPSSAAGSTSTPVSSGLSLLASSPSPALEHTNHQRPGRTAPNGAELTTTNSVSPLPKAPTGTAQTPQAEAPKAIVFAAYEGSAAATTSMNSKPTQPSSSSSSFTATRVNAAARRSQHGVMVGTPKPEEKQTTHQEQQMQSSADGPSTNGRKSDLSAVDVKPTSASLEKKLEALEVVKESLSSGTLAPATPPPATACSSGSNKSPSAALPATPLRLLSEEAVVAPSYLSSGSGTILSGQQLQVTAEGTQTVVHSSISSGVQTDLPLSAGVTESDDGKEDEDDDDDDDDEIKTFEDKCCGGDEPLPSLKETESPKIEPPKPVLSAPATCEMAIQATLPSNSEECSAEVTHRAPSTDPFENDHRGSSSRGSKGGGAKTQQGCCAIM